MRRALLVAALVLLWAFGCSSAPRPYAPVALPTAKNVILISIDTLRADRLGVYGYARPTSPNIDAFAREAVRFSRAYSSSNWTLPGHAGMLTGRMSSWHGAIMIGNSLRANAPLVSEVVRGAGMETAAFVSHLFVGAEYGFNRGFATFDMEQSVGSAALTDKAVAWLRNRPGARGFLLFLHYFDVHDPYGKADAPIARFTNDSACRGPVDMAQLGAAMFQEDWDRFACFNALYDADVALVDRELGRLFGVLRADGRFDDTLVIVASDHGELLGQGEGVSHGITLLEPEIAVPLIVRWPGGAGGNTYVPQPVSTIQIAPTILEALGLPVFDTDLPGLHGLLAGDAAPVWVAAEAENSGYTQIAVVKDHYKLFQAPTYHVLNTRLAPMLVDLDQSETTDLWSAKPEVARELDDLARQSGWYGEGVCHEFAYRLGAAGKADAIRITLPPGTQPLHVRPLRRLFAARKGELVERRPRVGQDGETLVLTLEPSPLSNGVSIVVPPGTPVTAEVVAAADNAPAMWIGTPATPWSGEARDLPTSVDRWTPQDEPAGDFIGVRSYGVPHLGRPAAGPDGAPVELTPEQRDTLRTLGYIGM